MRSSKPSRVGPDAELRDLLRHWSQVASVRGISQKAIRTVRIASELGDEGWPLDADAPPLTATAAFEPCIELRCVALARYCLKHSTERDSLLWRYRRQELKRLHGLAELSDSLAPEVLEARETRRQRSEAGKKGTAPRVKDGANNAKKVRDEWERQTQKKVPIPQRNVASVIARKLKFEPATVRRHLRKLGL